MKRAAVSNQQQETAATAAASKRCGGCKRLLQVIRSVTFTGNRTQPDRLQIYCRECDERHKARDPVYGWKMFEHALQREPHHVAVQWNRAKYAALFTRGECHWCGANLAEWGGKGHRIDRIDSLAPHVPDNCVACCAPCNHAKNSRSPESWTHEIQRLVATYGRGKIPWQSINPKGPGRTKIPDLSAYEVPTEQGVFQWKT